MLTITRPLKCLIQNLDDKTSVEAHFNPKEVGIDKKVPWNKHKDSKADTPTLEFTDAEPQELSMELLFDGYESRTDVYTAYISKLEGFTKIIASKKRPPMCLFLWGTFPAFMGVVESLSTKYTMFLPNGTPVRATCTIKMKQADRLTVGSKDAKGKKGKTPKAAEYESEGTRAREDEKRRADKFGTDHRKVLDANGSEDGTLATGSRVPTGS